MKSVHKNFLLFIPSDPLKFTFKLQSTVRGLKGKIKIYIISKQEVMWLRKFNCEKKIS